MEDEWQGVKGGVHEIYYGPPLSKARYMELYTYIVLFYQRHPKHYEETFNKIKQYISEVVDSVLQQLDPVGGEENFLAFYMKKWKWYKPRSKMLSRIYHQVNRTSKVYDWIVQGRFEDALENLTILLWKEILLKPRLTKLNRGILKIIEQHRNGGSINYEVIHDYFHHFEYMDGEVAMMDGYEKHFEKTFLRETSMYYSKEVIVHLQDHSNVSFIKKVEKFLKKEERLAQLCLHDRTKKALMGICETLLITQQFDLYINEFNQSLRSDNIEVLRIFHTIVDRLDHCRGKILTCFKNFVTPQFDAFFNHENLEMGLEVIFDVHRRYRNLIVAAFSGDSRFLVILDRACIDLIYKLLAAKGDPTREIGKLFAYYCNSLLQNSWKKLGDEEMEEHLTHVMRLLQNIDDNGTFEKLYWKLFSTRLVAHGAASEMVEISMIKKLKRKIGSDDAFKFRRMYEDSVLSKDLVENFKSHLVAKNDAVALEFSVQVLHRSHWPFNDPVSFNLPPEMHECAVKFSEFYKTRFKSKKICWQNHLSKGEIQANCYGKPYNFQASVYQMTVLLMFNDKDWYPIGEIVEETLIEMAILVPVVKSLIKAKLLISGDGNQKEDFTSKSVVKLCQVYRNKKLRVNILTPAPRSYLLKTRKSSWNEYKGA